MCFVMRGAVVRRAVEVLSVEMLSTRLSVEMFSTKLSVETPSTKLLVETLSTKTSVEVFSTKWSVETLSTKLPVEMFSTGWLGEMFSKCRGSGLIVTLRRVHTMHLMFKWLELEREPTVAERKGQRKRRI